MTRDVHWYITVDYQQIANDNMANQIHGFTIDYGKFILKCNITQLNTIHYNALYNMLSWEFKLAWGENCSKNRTIRTNVDSSIYGRWRLWVMGSWPSWLCLCHKCTYQFKKPVKFSIGNWWQGIRLVPDFCLPCTVSEQILNIKTHSSCWLYNIFICGCHLTL